MDLGKTQKASGMSHHPNATGDSWEEVRIVTLIGVWKSFIPTLTDDIKGFKTSVEEVTAYGVETERELELEVGPGDFPGGPEVKNLPCNAGDMGSIPGWGTNIPVTG